MTATDWQRPFTDLSGPIARFPHPPFEIPATPEDLRFFLQAALALEHLTIPPYLTALYSLRPGTNREAFFAIRAVVLEEMLHMTLVANLLNAVGGEPVVADPVFVTDYPVYLPFARDEVPIALRHFGPEALRTFLFIERPEAVAEVPPPHDNPDGWSSIGQFYAAIRQCLLTLCPTEEKERALFSGPRERQVGPGDFYNSGGEVFEITDLRSALKAVRVISEQGEGVSDTVYNSDDQLFGEAREPAHFFRFNEIYQGRRYGPHDTPSAGPTGPVLAVDWDAAYPIDPEAGSADYPPGSQVRGASDEFNRTYGRLLHLLQAAYTGQPQQLRAAVPAMLALRDQAERLYRNPHPGRPGLHASPTYEIDPGLLTLSGAQLADGVGHAGLLAGLA
ncbi:ferritin-like protein [Kitasatospora sp. NPDC051853]|uniref:ferritin-like protein n=1 Tax=Kitasatospora sp. NPDC051853 TaxID=3364058 RepID=UPI0037B76585